MDPSAARAAAEHFDRLAARYSELRDDEYAAGVAAAEVALPDEVDYDLLLLNVVATRP